MVKRILIFVATFVIALGGATAAVVARTKSANPVKPPADSAGTKRDSLVATDSVAAHDPVKVPVDSTHVALAATALAQDTVRAAPAHPVARDTATPIAANTPAPHPAPVAPAVAASAPIAPVSSFLAGGRLSKIFGAMSARDAAKVLEQMDDSDVKEILGRLNDKKAAEILALIPAARAAVISKAALAKPGAGK